MHEVEVKGILSAKNGMNIYRGCSHGCIYCDARSTCYQMQHPFEDIEVKVNAPQLLEYALKHKRSKCMIATGSMSDPYLHLEEKLQYTRRCLKLILQYGFGVSILTKSTRILRDLDLLEEINRNAKCVAAMTLTTYDEQLCRIIEPHVSTTKERYQALKTFQKHGIPTVVWLDPLLPYINDTKENVQGILEYCLDAGVKGIMCMGMGLTLREGNREYFYEKLDAYFPGMKARYCREFGNAYEIESPNSQELMALFTDTCRENGILYRPKDIFCYMAEFEDGYEQLSLF